MNIFKKTLPFFVVLVLSYWAIAPLLTPGFFPMHDDTQVARVFEMKKALADGMFPVRWVADLGYNYGYPIFNFYAPFAYYVGALFALIGVDVLLATKLMMVFGILLAGVSMYLFAKEFWGKLGGIAAALFYVYAPYHAVQVYVRGDVAEFFAYGFIPLAFWGIYKIFKSPQPPLRKGGVPQDGGFTLWLWLTVGSLAFAGIILSHNLTALMVTPCIFIFTILLYVYSSKHKSLVARAYLFLPLVIGVMLAAFYWLPVFPEMKYTNVLSVVGGGSDYKDHFVCPMQLWSSPWGFAGSASGCMDGVSFKIGKLHIVFSLFAVAALVLLFRKNKKEFGIVLLFAIFLLISLFLMLDMSKFIWDAIPHMSFFQFPWRFLILVSFFTSFLAGSFAWIVTRRLKPHFLALLISGLLLVAIVLANAKVFNPSTINNVTSDNFISSYMLSWHTAKISDEYMPVGFSKPQNKNEVPQNKIILQDPSTKIISLQSTTQKTEALIETREKTRVVLNIAYFPAWRLYIDDKEVSYEKSNKGLEVQVPAGKHTLEAIFVETPIEKMANFITIAGVLVLILGIIYTNEHKKAKS